ncbi:MAG: hypothetical protein WKG06_20270 [Segetibacter sp.]
MENRICIIRAAVTNIAVKSEVADLAKRKGWYNEIEESWVYGVAN